METSREAQLGSESIPKILFKLAVPAIMAQLINVLYNIVDRIYIGNIPEIGPTALTGVGVTFPMIMIISAFSAFVGMGGAPLASIKLGEKNIKGAEKILGNGVTILVCLSILLTILFAVFKTPLFWAFGASENTIMYADEYFSIYLCGTLFVQFALGLNTFISAQGHANTAMISVLIGAIINIVLDPIFIFVFGMGVQGAAVATVISQAASAVWIVLFLTSRKTAIKIRKGNLMLDPQILKNIAVLGISPFIMQATESFVQLTLNSSLQRYGGDSYVGCITIINSVMQLFVMPVNGFSQGAQPVLSYNYGARKMDRVRHAFKLTLITTVTMSSLACALSVFFPTVFARLFTRDAELISLVGKYMPIFMSGIFIFGVQMACQTTLLALGQAKISIFIALLRKVILLIPLAIILPIWFGVQSIFFAEPIADITAAVTTIILFSLSFRKILKRKLDEPLSQEETIS